MSALCFIDTETTSLRHDRRAWEIGIIARQADGTQTEHHWFIDATADDLDLGNADVMSLKIGRFYDRHPMATSRDPAAWDLCDGESEVLLQVEEVTRGAHLVGAVVSFDADVLGQRMRANGICPSWHYHLIDVEALAVGYMAGSAAFGQSPSGRKQAESRDLIRPPWNFDDLSAYLGVTVSDQDRHTALGDARWAMAIYDKVMGR